MITVTARDLDAAFLCLSQRLQEAPVVSPRGHRTREVLMTGIELREPSLCILQHPARQISTRYIQAEIDWYLSGTRSIAPIARHARAWGAVADPDGMANSAYGWQVFVQSTPTGVSQFEDVLRTLLEDPDSRRAVINIHQLRHKYATKDVPCTIALQFLLRDSRLHQLVLSRSTDLVWGLGNDVPFFVFLQSLLSAALRKNGVRQDLGSYCQVFGSIHVYERHFEMVRQVCGTRREYQSAQLASVLSESARTILMEGRPAVRPERLDSDSSSRSVVEPGRRASWREMVRRKISRIREREDANIYPLY